MGATDWNQRGHVLATCDEQVVYCRVVGIGNMNNCTPFQQFSTHMQGKGYQQFILDFSACDGLDSTFLGTILGIAMGRSGVQTRVVVINASTGVRRILGEVGIDHLLEVRSDAMPFPDLPLQRLEPRGESTRSRLGTVLEAHENLCRVAAGNQQKFGAFVHRLRDELAAADPNRPAEPAHPAARDGNAP